MLDATRLCRAASETACLHRPSKPRSRLGLPTLAHRMKRAVSLAAIALSLSLCGPLAAKAELVLYHVYFGDSDDKDDPDYVDYFIDDETFEHWMGVKDKDGTYTLAKTGVKGNPTPDDPSSGPKGDRESQVALAKQNGGGDVWGERDFWKTPAGKDLGGGGKGPGPVINPSDDDPVKGGTGNPSLGQEDLGKPQIIDKTGSLGSGKGGGFQFNAGSPGEQLKKPGGPGGPPGGNQSGSDDDDDKGSDKPPPGSNYGPAELVDPLGPPVARSATKQTGKVAVGALGGPDTRTGKAGSGETVLPYVEQKSLKKTGGKTNGGKTNGSARGVIAIIKPGEKTGIGHFGAKGQSSMTAPGLLQTNTGFAASGPSAMGATVGARR